MLFVCHPKILHKHCLQFLLGVKMAPRELKTMLIQSFGVQAKSIMHDRTHRASTVSTAYESLVHCTRIPNIPSPKSRWLFFPQRPVKCLNPLLCQEWRQYIENKTENARRKTWHNYCMFFFFKEDVNRRKRRLNMIRKNSFKSLCLSVAFENIKLYSN